MNFKTFTVLILLLLWFGFSWFWYICRIKGFCNESNNSFKQENIKIQNPIEFSLGSNNAILHNFDKYRDSICNFYKDKPLMITGSFFDKECNTSSSENLGLSRAQALKNLLSTCMDSSKIFISSKSLETPTNTCFPYNFLSLSIKDTTNLANLNEVKIVTNGDISEVYFPYNSSVNKYSKEFDAQMETIISKMKVQNGKIKLEGHTDNQGNANSNLQLSIDRCNQIKKYLTDKNISSDNIIVEGFGQTKPKVENNTLENRAINRRVEIKIIK